VGFPNAGKSTLLSVMTNARPKIAGYPFTTLHPNLGVLYLYEKEYVMADLPGLIEGASEGAGLGHRFLGHAERCQVILHLVDSSLDSPLKNYEAINDELEKYNPELRRKPQIVVLSKCELIDETVQKKLAQDFKKKFKISPVFISSVARKGLEEMKQTIAQVLQA